MTKHDLSQLRIDRNPQETGPPRRSSRLSWLILALLLSYIGWKELGSSVELDDGVKEVAIARVTRLGASRPKSAVAANGYIVARTRAALSTDISGRLVELRVEEGSRVERGTLIARLDTRELEAARDRAAANIRQAEASERIAALELKRLEPLIAAGDASESDRDRAQADLDIAQAQISSLRATVAEIEVRIDKSSVYAPFDGIVVEKNAELGEVVSSIGAGGNSRGSVATLVDFESLEVQVELAESSLAAARIGAAVLIELDAYPGSSYPGRVRQIWPTANRQKATVELRAEFLERDERILPELGVRVLFVDEAESSSGASSRVLIPEAAITNWTDPAVFVVESGVVRRVAVEIEPAEEPGQVRVVAGLIGGEAIVVELPADSSLRDGDLVKGKVSSK